MDILCTIVSFMNRKKKYELSRLNKDFYNMVVPRSMVSLRFMSNRTLDDKLFKSQIARFIKVSILNLEDLKIHNPSVAANFASSLTENEHFCSRLEEIQFRNI